LATRKPKTVSIGENGFDNGNLFDQKIQQLLSARFRNCFLFWAMRQVLMEVVVDPQGAVGSNNNLKHLSGGKQPRRLTL
jgi:hypothetical protein